MNKAFEKILEFIDEQIKIEESIAKSKNEGHPITHQYGANCMNVIKKFVQEVAEEYNNGWIACSVRLPEESLNSVIGWDAYRDRCVFAQYIQGKFQNMGKDDSFDIKAWMPLPEPFKECD